MSKYKVVECPCNDCFDKTGELIQTEYVGDGNYWCPCCGQTFHDVGYDDSDDALR